MIMTRYLTHTVIFKKMYMKMLIIKNLNNSFKIKLNMDNIFFIVFDHAVNVPSIEGKEIHSETIYQT